MENKQPNMVQWVSVSIIIGAVIISGAIIYSNSSTPAVGNNNQPGQPTGSVTVSMDDDAVLGDANAPVTLIEFSDYECPFCKRHVEQVYPEIKKNYIDTGKVKMVFRDFVAVTAHNPLATTEAEAAQCAKDQGGDNAYFAYHDQIFAKTTSNGAGLAVSELPKIAQGLGLNVDQFNQCLSSRKFKGEVEKDMADAAAAGVTGTPSFFVGKSTADGKITGKIIVGAQPYSAFQAAIEEALK